MGFDVPNPFRGNETLACGRLLAGSQDGGMDLYVAEVYHIDERDEGRCASTF